MIFFAWIIWISWIFSVFGGFTFTDWQDFLPLLTLGIGLVGLIALQFWPRKLATPALIALMTLLSLWPVLPQIGLYFLAREFQMANANGGNWPQVMVDDPKNWLGHVSPRFDALFHVVSYLESFAGAYLVLFFALLFGLRARFSRRCQWIFAALCGISMLIFLFDPGDLYSWWLD